MQEQWRWKSLQAQMWCHRPPRACDVPHAGSSSSLLNYRSVRWYCHVLILLAVDLNGTTGKRRSRVIKVITIISNHLLVHETRSFSVPLQAQQLSSYKLMWWKRAEERAGRFFFFSFLTVGKKAVAIMGKVANQEYLITAVRTHTGLCRHLLCPRFLWRIGGLTHLFHCLRASASRSVWWGKNHKPNQGNRYERHKQLYQSPPCNYLQHLLDTHRQSAVGLFHGSSRDTKTYYQSNFPLSPRAKQSVWETHALFILAETEQERGRERASLTEPRVRESP